MAVAQPGGSGCPRRRPISSTWCACCAPIPRPRRWSGCAGPPSPRASPPPMLPNPTARLSSRAADAPPGGAGPGAARAPISRGQICRLLGNATCRLGASGPSWPWGPAAGSRQVPGRRPEPPRAIGGSVSAHDPGAPNRAQALRRVNSLRSGGGSNRSRSSAPERGDQVRGQGCVCAPLFHSRSSPRRRPASWVSPWLPCTRSLASGPPHERGEHRLRLSARFRSRSIRGRRTLPSCGPRRCRRAVDSWRRRDVSPLELGVPMIDGRLDRRAHGMPRARRRRRARPHARRGSPIRATAVCTDWPILVLVDGEEAPERAAGDGFASTRHPTPPGPHRRRSAPTRFRGPHSSDGNARQVTAIAHTRCRRTSSSPPRQASRCSASFRGLPRRGGRGEAAPPRRSSGASCRRRTQFENLTGLCASAISSSKKHGRGRQDHLALDRHSERQRHDAIRKITGVRRHRRVDARKQSASLRSVNVCMSDVRVRVPDMNDHMTDDSSNAIRQCFLADRSALITWRRLARSRSSAPVCRRRPTNSRLRCTSATSRHRSAEPPPRSNKREDNRLRRTGNMTPGA